VERRAREETALSDDEDGLTLKVVFEECARCKKHVGDKPVEVDLSPPELGMAGHAIKFCSRECAIEDLRSFFEHLERELRRLEDHSAPVGVPMEEAHMHIPSVTEILELESKYGPLTRLDGAVFPEEHRGHEVDVLDIECYVPGNHARTVVVNCSCGAQELRVSSQFLVDWTRL